MKTELSWNPGAVWVFNALNLCVDFDGTLVPRKGHNGNCKWKYDGQVFYHLKKGK